MMKYLYNFKKLCCNFGINMLKYFDGLNIYCKYLGYCV